MLSYPAFNISKSQVKVKYSSKDGHNAHLLTTKHQLEAKPVHEA